jgi:hypothetical protein
MFAAEIYYFYIFIEWNNPFALDTWDAQLSSEERLSRGRNASARIREGFSSRIPWIVGSGNLQGPVFRPVELPDRIGNHPPRT